MIILCAFISVLAFFAWQFKTTSARIGGLKKEINDLQHSVAIYRETVNQTRLEKDAQFAFFSQQLILQSQTSNTHMQELRMAEDRRHLEILDLYNKQLKLSSELHKSCSELEEQHLRDIQTCTKTLTMLTTRLKQLEPQLANISSPTFASPSQRFKTSHSSSPLPLPLPTTNDGSTFKHKKLGRKRRGHHPISKRKNLSIHTALPLSSASSAISETIPTTSSTLLTSTVRMAPTLSGPSTFPPPSALSSAPQLFGTYQMEKEQMDDSQEGSSIRADKFEDF